MQACTCTYTHTEREALPCFAVNFNSVEYYNVEHNIVFPFFLTVYIVKYLVFLKFFFNSSPFCPRSSPLSLFLSQIF